MTPFTSLADLALLRESVSLECKLAAGRDGQGALPEDFWSTYSAFANTDGGVVLFEQGFLQMLGGWQQDRATGENGLTVAGLLMFGRWPSIAEALPMYFVDYQERPANDATTVQWLDRLVPDGTWSGNVFDFYRRVVNKLVVDLKVPFVLKGALRVPAEQALQGGGSDCRNRTMQQMFLMIGLGERAGSGMSRIVHGWKDLGHGMHLTEHYEPQEYTVLEMTWAAAELAPTLSPESSVKSTGETGAEILSMLQENPALTIPALAQHLQLSTRAVEKQISKRRTVCAGWVPTNGGIGKCRSPSPDARTMRRPVPHLVSLSFGPSEPTP